MQHTRSVHRSAASPRYGRTCRTRSHYATGATPGSRGTPRPCRTTTAAHRPTAGSERHPEPESPPEATPVRWRTLFPLTRLRCVHREVRSCPSSRVSRLQGYVTPVTLRSGTPGTSIRMGDARGRVIPLTRTASNRPPRSAVTRYFRYHSGYSGESSFGVRQHSGHITPGRVSGVTMDLDAKPPQCGQVIRP